MGWLIGLGCVVALLVGIWIGMPRRFDQSLDEIDQRLGEKGEHQTVKRKRTILTILRKATETGSERRRRGTKRRPFDLR